MTLQEQLADAKAQYHLLVTGQAASVIVDQNGERIEFRATNQDKLLSYIRGLEAQIAAQSGAKPGLGPMRVFM